MRHLTCLLLLFLVSPHLGAQQPNDTIFALRECESRVPVVGPMRADGIVAALLRADGRIDTSTTRVLQVESVSVAAYRSAAARILSTCRYRVTGAKERFPLPVVIALQFQGGPASVASAEQVPQLETGLEPGPVLIPTQDLPLAPEDRRIEESPIPEPGCSVWRRFGGTRYYRSAAEAMRDINTRMVQQSGNLKVEFEVNREGRVAASSVKLLQSDNAKAAESFVETIQECRYMPARIGGVPVPVRMTMSMASGGMR